MQNEGVPEPDARGHDAWSVKPGTQWKAESAYHVREPLSWPWTARDTDDRDRGVRHKRPLSVQSVAEPGITDPPQCRGPVEAPAGAHRRLPVGWSTP
jgi:hypothetical protein